MHSPFNSKFNFTYNLIGRVASVDLWAMSIESVEIPNGIVHPIRGQQMGAQNSKDDLRPPLITHSLHIGAHCGMALHEASEAALISHEQTSLVSLFIL
jgi:hypothetical protein